MIELVLPGSILLSVVLWLYIGKLWLVPLAEGKPFETIVRPILVLHSFRFVGMMFLFYEGIDPKFAIPAAYGDLIAAALAGLSLWLLEKGKNATWLIWIFAIQGFLDMVMAVSLGLAFVHAHEFGPAIWIPVLIVPPLVASHLYLFRLLIDKPKRVFA